MVMEVSHTDNIQYFKILQMHNDKVGINRPSTQVWWQWQPRLLTFIQTSSPFAGSVREGSYVQFLSLRLLLLPGLMEKVSFRQWASADFPRQSWKEERPGCGSLFTTWPWNGPSPGKPEVSELAVYNRNTLEYCFIKNNALNLFF